MATLLQKEGLCSRAVAKEHILPATDLAGGLRVGGCDPCACIAANCLLITPVDEPGDSVIVGFQPRLAAGLNSEQVAMVDLLVLARTRGFVGHVASTFSFVAHDLRVIRLGAGAGTGRLIDFPPDQHHAGNSFLPVALKPGR